MKPFWYEDSLPPHRLTGPIPTKADETSSFAVAQGRHLAAWRVMVFSLVLIPLVVGAGFFGYAAASNNNHDGGPSLRNPTYEELQEFLAEDETDSNQYTPGEYVCLHFAADLDNKAEEKGLRCGFVFLKYVETSGGGVYGHFLNCFETMDRGLIYIEPQTDQEMEVETGGEYWGHAILEIVVTW